MGLSRSEAIEKINAQRASIKEHIEKYNRYSIEYEKKFALDTISRCQSNIADLKRRCDSNIDSSYEDTWRP